MSDVKKTWNGIRDGADKVGRELNRGVKKHGVFKEGERLTKRVIENIKDPKGSIRRDLEDIGLVPEIPEPEEQVIIPIPDENSAALEAKRRRAKAPKTGRDSTILTEGLGG
jgi:hypothetical protein